MSQAQHKRQSWLQGLFFKAFLPTGWLCLSLFSCSDPPPLKLTLQQRDWVDTLYLRRVEGLSAKLDSQCVVKRERELQALVDSIVAMRRYEEELLRAKYQK